MAITWLMVIPRGPARDLFLHSLFALLLSLRFSCRTFLGPSTGCSAWTAEIKCMRWGGWRKQWLTARPHEVEETAGQYVFFLWDDFEHKWSKMRIVCPLTLSERRIIILCCFYKVGWPPSHIIPYTVPLSQDLLVPALPVTVHQRPIQYCSVFSVGPNIHKQLNLGSEVLFEVLFWISLTNFLKTCQKS